MKLTKLPELPMTPTKETWLTSASVLDWLDITTNYKVNRKRIIDYKETLIGANTDKVIYIITAPNGNELKVEIPKETQQTYATGTNTKTNEPVYFWYYRSDIGKENGQLDTFSNFFNEQEKIINGKASTIQ